MEISLEEAFDGKTAQIRIPTSVTCEACSGTGAKAGTKPKTCATCGGAGQDPPCAGLLHARAHLSGLPGPRPGDRRSLSVLLAAPAASRASAMLSVNIPAGVEDGTRIRLAGEGEAGVRGGPPGDLYIFLSLTPHEFFQRDGADLHCRVPISMVTAALGGEFEVPAIDGSKAKVKVPAGTQTGRRFRLTGKGMPVLRSKQTGDMYVQVSVETPQNLTKRQRELLAEFEKLSSETTQPEAAGFFSRVKEFLDGLWEVGAAIPASHLDPLRPRPYTRRNAGQSSLAAGMRDPIAMPSHSVARVEKKPLRLDDEMQFIRSWIEKPLSTGAVMPSSKALARTMARYVDPHANGPVIELGPGTGPVTEALVEQRRRSGAADPGRIQSRFLPPVARALSGGDGGAGRRLPAAPAARRPT